jgi:hypothetical protein
VPPDDTAASRRGGTDPVGTEARRTYRCRPGSSVLLSRPVSVSRRLVRATVRSFGINVLIQLVLHPFLPLAFFAPVVLGFATGWDLRARPTDGVAVGLLMGLYMLVLVSAVGTGFLILVGAADYWWIVLAIACFAVAHLALFSGFGAVLGGHYARREDSGAAEASPLAGTEA